MFAANHSMSADDEQILTFFTQQEIRSIEQSYSTYAEPINYKGIPHGIIIGTPMLLLLPKVNELHGLQ